MLKDKDFNRKIGLRIRELRQKRTITQEKLSDLSGVDSKHIQLLEGLRPSDCRIGTIRNIAKAFGLTLSEFFIDSFFEEQIQNNPSNKNKHILNFHSNLNTNREKILEDNQSFAIYEKDPVTRGHIIIVPKRNFNSYFDSYPEEKQSFLEMIDKVIQFQKREFKPDGWNVGFNEGIVSGQTETFFSIHIIPRYKGDMNNPAGGVRGVIPDKQKPQR